MARGLQAQQARAKAAEKAANLKKQAGNNKYDNTKTAAAAGLKFTCSVCRSAMPDLKTYKQHFESKHPKTTMPEELKDADANMKEVTAFLNMATPVKKPVGVVALKGEEVEVFDILDESTDDVELSLVESPLLRYINRFILTLVCSELGRFYTP